MDETVCISLHINILSNIMNLYLLKHTKAKDFGCLTKNVYISYG